MVAGRGWWGRGYGGAGTVSTGDGQARNVLTRRFFTFLFVPVRFVGKPVRFGGGTGRKGIPQVIADAREGEDWALSYY